MKEGKEANFFDNCIPPHLQEDSKAWKPTGEYQEEEMGVLLGGSDRAEMIDQVWNMGYDVDDDNAPAPENMPTVSTTITPTPTADEFAFKDWNSYCFCRRLCEGHQQEYPMFMSNNTNDKPHMFLAWFVYLCPIDYINETLIPATN